MSQKDPARNWILCGLALVGVWAPFHAAVLVYLFAAIFLLWTISDRQGEAWEQRKELFERVREIGQLVEDRGVKSN